MAQGDGRGAEVLVGNGKLMNDNRIALDRLGERAAKLATVTQYIYLLKRR